MGVAFAIIALSKQLKKIANNTFKDVCLDCVPGGTSLVTHIGMCRFKVSLLKRV